jgi:hypothetical protein
MMWRSLIGHCLPVRSPLRQIGFPPFSFLLAICAADAVAAPNMNPTATPRLLSAPKHGLNFVVGARGIDSLSFNGESLLASPKNGELQPEKSALRTVLDAVLPLSLDGVAAPNKKPDSVELTYPWGRISCAYSKQNNRLTMGVEVSNTSSKDVDEFSVRLMELKFPRIPKGGSLEAGMFGFGFKGPEWLLDQSPPSIPLIADPRFVVPIVAVDYGTGALNFCSDDSECAVSVPYSTNFPARTSYPFIITCRDVKPGARKTFHVSLRFGPAGAQVQDLSADALENYAKHYPFEVNWSDRRPIGAIFLAGPQVNVSSNPRRWTVNFGEVDVTNDKGKATFRTALLKLADDSIRVLKDTGAQGMITWDPEGEEFPGACYYGDPRLVPTFAPEMEFKGDSGKSVIDEYFEKFRAAGLKTGICIRPQDVAMIDGKPVHQAADDDQAVRILREKVAYANKRWGCTLFYVDSTATAGRPFYPEVFEAVAKAFPDVLLIPENESMRYFAYSAPLNSYQHHKVTSTPLGARLVYPKSFCVLMAADGDQPQDHTSLLDAVRHGDILLFNGWYGGPPAEKIKNLYSSSQPR